MNREQKILLTVVSAAVLGWLAAAGTAVSLVTFKVRAMSAEDDAATWKRQAGKAYTEMLHARAGTSSTTVLVPKGARIDCTMTTSNVDGKFINKCENGVIYPPNDY